MKKTKPPPMGLKGPSARLNWWLDANYWPPLKRGRATEVCNRANVTLSAARKYLNRDTIPRYKTDKDRLAEIFDIPLSYWEYGDPAGLKAYFPETGEEDPLLIVQYVIAIEREAVKMGITLKIKTVEEIRRMALIYASKKKTQPPDLKIIRQLIELSQ